MPPLKISEVTSGLRHPCAAAHSCTPAEESDLLVLQWGLAVGCGLVASPNEEGKSNPSQAAGRSLPPPGAIAKKLFLWQFLVPSPTII